MKRVSLAMLLAAFIAVIGAAAVHAQDVTPVPQIPAVPYPANTITVTGFGTASGEPDVAYLDLGVNFTSPDLGEAFSQASSTMNSIVEALTELGIAREDIQTSGVNIYPQDQYDPQTGTPTGERTYNVSNTVRITIRDISKVEDAITAAINAGANTINGLTFGIADTSALEQEARTQAVENARERATQLAQALGVSVGEPLIINESYGTAESPRPFGGGGFGGAAMDVAALPISQGQSSVSVVIQVTFTINR